MVGVKVFDDSLQQVEPVTLPLLKAQIHKVQADLQSYALDTNNPEVIINNLNKRKLTRVRKS